MKDIAKQIVLLQKKIEHSSNDLFKQIAKDLVHLVLEDNQLEYSTLVCNEYISRLEEAYKDQLGDLRREERVKSKQVDIEEEIQNLHRGTDLL